MNWWDYSVGRAHSPTDDANGGELGIDLRTPVGTSITTPWSALVTYVGNSASTGWIVKALTNVPGIGPVYEYFLHLISVNVSSGQRLAAGTRVGLSGGLQPGAGGWPHVEFGLFTSSAYASRYWGFVTGSTLDPTPVIAALRNGEHSMVPNGWTDDGTTLKAPNGVEVVKGFRNFVLAQNWPDYDWPLVPEYATESVEPGNPTIGAGSRQEFRLGSLGWTASRGVYRIWIGQDYLEMSQDIATKNAHIAAAKAALGG